MKSGQRTSEQQEEIKKRTTIDKDGYTERKCRKCDVWQPIENYHYNSRYYMEHVHECKKCVSEYCGKRNTPEKNRNDHLKQRFNITQEEYIKLYQKQNGKCAICGDEYDLMNENFLKILHVDHCHNSNKVRGLLCNDCNLGIGHLKDNPTLLELAIKYLKGVNGTSL